MSELHDIPIAQPLITFCEENFDCELGLAKAFFELPQRDCKDPVRVTYVVYAIEGPTYDECESWMIDNVFMPMVQQAGKFPILYWRLSDMFQVTVLRDRVRIRTRLAVLNREKLQPVVIEPAVKTEGAECPRIGSE